jgi:hypothetical protein
MSPKLTVMTKYDLGADLASGAKTGFLAGT